MEAVKRGKLNLNDHDAVFHGPNCISVSAISLLERIHDLTFSYLQVLVPLV